MSEPVDETSAAELVWREEMASAERRGAARVRQRIRSIAPERRRLLREGGRVVELVELEAVEQALDAD